LTDLVRRAEAGEDIVLTRHGQAAVRLTPVARTLDAGSRLALLNDVRASALSKITPGASAARSQDFLYDDGVPG
ncbi:hypothetical protein LTR94_026654, partial [Friedmanniomyces endolithicus]